MGGASAPVPAALGPAPPLPAPASAFMLGAVVGAVGAAPLPAPPPTLPPVSVLLLVLPAALREFSASAWLDHACPLASYQFPPWKYAPFAPDLLDADAPGAEPAEVAAASGVVSQRARPA